MGDNGNHRWRNPFHRSSNPKQPPKEYLCPISRSLMADPVVVSSGETFERISAQICRNLGFSPVLDDGSKPDFSAIIPNLAIRTSIINWCDKSGVDHPAVPDYISIEKLVRSMMGSEQRNGVSESELILGVADNPPVLFSHAVSDLYPCISHCSDESDVFPVSLHTPLPLTTRPACYSASSSSEIMEDEITKRRNTFISDADSDSSDDENEDEDLVGSLNSSEIHEQEEAVIFLRKVTKTKEELRNSLCTPAILTALRSLIVSRYGVVQTNAIAALVNLSLEKSNKLKIVRSGLVPFIIDALKSGCNESQEHAAGALFSLAIDDENKMAIGVLGALPPLLHALRSESKQTRNDSALALYHLTLNQSNRVKVVNLGAVASLLSMAKTADLANRVLLVLCNLGVCTEGRSAMLDANAVAILVGILREKEMESPAVRENCVAAMFALSRGSLRFKGLAKAAGAAEVLREVEERGTERAREKARRILEMMRGREEAEEAAEGGDWDRGLHSSGFSHSRRTVFGGGGGGGSWKSC